MTPNEENSHEIKSGENEKDGAGGIFQFPTFKVGSFVKNQSLQFKIPTAQAITILYGSNKPKGDSDPEFANGQLDKLFRHDNSKDFKDRYLGDMKSSHQNSAGNKGVIKTNVGSQNVNPNSRISFSDNFGIPINTKSSWWRQWTPDIENKDSSTSDKAYDAGFYEIAPTKDGKDVQVQFTQNGRTNPVKNLYKQVNEKGASDNKHLILNSRIQSRLNSYLNSNSPVQQFDMNNLIPAELGLEIDGTGGTVHPSVKSSKSKSSKSSSPTMSSSLLGTGLLALFTSCFGIRFCCTDWSSKVPIVVVSVSSVLGRLSGIGDGIKESISSCDGFSSNSLGSGNVSSSSTNLITSLRGIWFIIILEFN